MVSIRTNSFSDNFHSPPVVCVWFGREFHEQQATETGDLALLEDEGGYLLGFLQVAKRGGCVGSRIEHFSFHHVFIARVLLHNPLNDWPTRQPTRK
jgi:hypothetical protein